MPCAGLGAVGTAGSKTDTVPILTGHRVLWGRHSVNNEMNEQVSFLIAMVSLKDIKQKMGKNV